MSLRWRLLRFLRASEEVLNTSQSTSAPLLPTALSQKAEQDAQTFAGRLSSASLRATHAHGTPSLRALAQPRGAVEVLGSEPHTLRTVLPAHDRVAVAVNVSNGVVITLGIDDTHAALKTWRFVSSSPLHLECTSVARFAPDLTPTALAVRSAAGDSETPPISAVGFADGSITLLRGDLERNRVVRRRVAPAPGEMSEPRPVIALAFADDTLFVATETSVALIDTSSTGDDRRSVLDTRGAARAALCTLLPASGHFCVAREEALYFFTRDGRGPCLAFPTRVADGFVGTTGRYVLHGAGNGEVVAYDTAHKVLAYRGRGDVRCAFVDNCTDGSTAAALVCMKDGSVRRLVEIALRDRVEMLIERGLHVAAVALAKSESAEEKSKLLMYAIRQRAEHNISNGHFDAAAEQLVETIGGGVEASWVISRLVEQPGLRSGLRLFLEALHAAGSAAFVHTKVLITCYRHDRARAAVLPRTSPEATASTTDEHIISVMADIKWSSEQIDAAIAACRSAGLARVAESLARQHDRHVARAQVLSDDLNDIPGVLELLSSLSEGDSSDTQVAAVLHAVARKLLVSAPRRFVDFLADALSRSTARGGANPVVKLTDFAPLFADRPRLHAVLLERVLARPGALPTSHVPDAWLSLFESLVCVDVAERVSAALPGTTLPVVSLDTGVSDTDELRTIASQSTIVESNTHNRAARVGQRALKTLQSRRSAIDLRKALRIAQLHGHDPCLEYLYEYLRMYRELAVTLRLTGNGRALLRAARRHGEREPALWLEALRLFAPLACLECLASEAGDEKVPSLDCADSDSASAPSVHLTHVQPANAALHEAVGALSSGGTMCALEIVDAVCDASPSAPWSVLNKYLTHTLGTLASRAAHEENAGMRLELELGELRRETARLGEEAVVIKPHLCSSCEDAAAVPMIHFFCGHSFHAACLAPAALAPPMRSLDSVDDGTWIEECPRCVPEMDVAVSMRQAIEERNVKHDEFFAKINGSTDGFAVVIDYLERSAFI